ncbi:tail fiber protein [Vibrio phage vB_VhaM_VH-8]|nr:tail fiber protein [Vibrio phage vB_VhaM_VH-8]
MAELKITDLPLMSEEEFTANDRFVMVDDGKAKAMTKTVFDSWIANNVQGEKGEQGVAGRDGANGTNGRDGEDGADGLSAYQVAVNSGYTGTQEQWLSSLKGKTGAAGANGTNGWSPILKIVPRGSDNILQLYDWTGGTGDKPSVLGYIGSTGIVTNPANAVNIRGLKGDTGEQGIQGEQGESGENGKTVQSIVFNPDLSVTVSYTDDTTVTSDAPPKQYGWGAYRDGQYGQTSPLVIPANTQVILPNNAATIIENLPTGVNSFYNPTSQKYLLQDTLGWYTIRVKFKVSASNQPSYINLSMSDGTTNLPYTEDRSLRGDNQIQYVDLVSEQYGSAALASNGMSISIKAYERAISIYDVEVSIAKVV